MELKATLQAKHKSMPVIRRLMMVMLTIAFTANAKTQGVKRGNYYSSIKQYNTSRLWREDSIVTSGDGDKIPFPEPLGFIGDSLQRFFIHYTSVTKSKKNPYQYDVKGKTKVKDNIRSFSGTITIVHATVYKSAENPGYRQGSVICLVKFYEDSTKTLSGSFKGKLTTSFYLDKKGRIGYNALRFESDGFKNNQCGTVWSSYELNKTRKCNWGDFRIPGSKALDQGSGDFSVKEKYVSHGWQNYTKAYSGSGPEAEKALAIEKEKWWNK